MAGTPPLRKTGVVPITPFEVWCYSARDPLEKLPYVTHMLYRCCNSEPDRFDLAVSILEVAFNAGREYEIQQLKATDGEEGSKT